MRKMGTIDARFTNIADNVTEAVGKWWFTVISLIILLAWIVYGILAIPGWFTSPVWNFPANSITTLGEWFMAGLTLAAANRVERRNISLQEQMLQIIQHIHGIAKEEKKTVKGAEETLSFQDQQLLSIVKHLEQIDHLILQLQEKKDG